MSRLRFFSLFGSDPAKYANVLEANTARTTSTIVVATQQIDSSGKVPPAGDTLGNAPFNKNTNYDSNGNEIFTHSNPATVIESDHRQIHKSNHFTVSKIFSSVASGSYALVRVKPGATYALHLVFNISTNSEMATLEILENCTFTNNGTALTAYNNDRSSSQASTATLNHTPTINSAGTTIYTSFFGSSAFVASKSCNLFSSRQEWILKPNTEYCFRIQNNGVAAQDIGIELMWYEPIT